MSDAWPSLLELSELLKFLSTLPLTKLKFHVPFPLLLKQPLRHGTSRRTNGRRIGMEMQAIARFISTVTQIQT